MIRDLVAGIDSSTQSTTVVLREIDGGAVVAEARSPHPPTTPPCSEQDPRVWWSALTDCLGRLSTHLCRVAAMSVGGQGHGLVILGPDDAPLRPAKLWNDTESAPDAVTLLERRPPREWARRIASVPGPAMTISKIAWTERRHPGLMAKAARVMLPFDYIVYRLCGRAVTERGGATGTGYFNPFDNVWDHDLAALAAPEVEWPAVTPEVIGSSDAAGQVGDWVGFPDLTGAVVGAGTGDNMAAALGLGVKEGDRVISLGTSGTIYAVTPVKIRDETGAINGFADTTERFMPMVTTLNAAKVTDAFRRLMRLDVHDFDTQALKQAAGSRGVVLVPYLDGERTPNLSEATGTLVGLRSDTPASALARAVVEGVLCGLLEGGDLLTAAGVPDNGRLILTGGAARSDSYRQGLADLTDKEIWVSPLVETAAAGAAVQAAAALSGATCREIAERWAPPLTRVATPDPENAARREATRTAYRLAAARMT